MLSPSALMLMQIHTIAVRIWPATYHAICKPVNLRAPPTFLLSAVDTGLDCMEEVLHTTELLGDSVVRGGTRSAVPSAEETRLYSERALLGSAVR